MIYYTSEIPTRKQACVCLEGTYFSEEELFDHAKNQGGPEHMQKQQDHQHYVKEIIAEKGFKLVQRINPRTVNQPVYTTQKFNRL